jgi:hypothetical protein
MNARFLGFVPDRGALAGSRLGHKAKKLDAFRACCAGDGEIIACVVYQWACFQRGWVCT